MHILTSLSAPSSQHSWTQRQVFEFRAQGVSCVWGQKVIGQGESEVISSFPLPFILTCELEFYVGSQDVNIIVLYSWFHVDTRSDFLIFQEWVVTQISYQYDIVHTNIYGKNIFYIFFIIFLWAGCLHGESLIAPFVCFLFFCSFLKAHQERWGRFFGSLKVGEIRKQENPKWRWFPTIISFWKSFSVVGKQPGWCQEGLTVYFWSGEQESATISWFSYNWGWSEHLRESSSLRTGLPWTTQCRLSDNVIIIMWIHCWCILDVFIIYCIPHRSLSGQHTYHAIVPCPVSSFHHPHSVWKVSFGGKWSLFIQPGQSKRNSLHAGIPGKAMESDTLTLTENASAPSSWTNLSGTGRSTIFFFTFLSCIYRFSVLHWLTFTVEDMSCTIYNLSYALK